MKWSAHHLRSGRGPTLPLLSTAQTPSDMPTLPLQSARRPTQAPCHMCTLARLVILATPFAVLADEAVSQD